MQVSLGNILKSPRVGLIFIHFDAKPKRLRVNGHCTIEDQQPNNEQKLIIRVEADEIFPNCPRYIPDLAKRASSPYFPDEGGVGTKPAWKSRDGLRNALPENDPHRD